MDEMDLGPYLKSLPDEAARRDFAKRCKTTLPYLMQVAGGFRAGSPALAKRIAKESDGRVPKHRSRPDVFDPPKASTNVEALA